MLKDISHIKYPPHQGGISRHNRLLLATLYRKFPHPFTANEVSDVLSFDIRKTQRFLAYLADKGWLARISHGIYIAVPLEATNPSQWHEDSWVAATKVWEPCYIAGWSACEHWGFTEQIFRDVAVVTSRRIRNRHPEIQGIPFRVKVLPENKIFGTATIWRGQVRVQISDPSRTVVDILDDPSLGGGLRHIAQVIREYFESQNRKDRLLVEYADKLGNRSVFKRLGVLLESLKINAPELVIACRERISSGVTLLDPTAIAKGPVTSRWNLRLNVRIPDEVS